MCFPESLERARAKNGERRGIGGGIEKREKSKKEKNTRENKESTGCSRGGEGDGEGRGGGGGGGKKTPVVQSVRMNGQ